MGSVSHCVLHFEFILWQHTTFLRLSDEYMQQASYIAYSFTSAGDSISESIMKMEILKMYRNK